RRRDPLVQWIALLNRAVFWFHPLAWWLDRELSLLAEEACDAAVISKGHEPREYAGYLLDLARSATGLRILGMAAPGVSLRQRLIEILTNLPPYPVSKTRSAFSAVACIIAGSLFTFGSLVHAQLTAPAFEVASIKPNRSGEQGGASRFD